MKKDANSNKKKIKLRRIEEAKKAKRVKSKMAQMRRVVAESPKEPISKKKILTISSFIGLLYLFLIIPATPLASTQNIENKICSEMHYDRLSNPYKIFTPKKTKKKIANSILHNNISSIIKNTPMEEMTDYIADRDDTVAAFIVGIAMKESKFGKYSPKKDGKECYNYWGYRGKENTTDSGYSCFDSPKHAIKVVGDRIESITKRGVSTPAQMISWKCGSSCAGHNPVSVDKWIADVGINYYRIQDAVKLARK